MFELEVRTGSKCSLGADPIVSVLLMGGEDGMEESGKRRLQLGKWRPTSILKFTVGTSKNLGRLSKLTVVLGNPSLDHELIIEDVSHLKLGFKSIQSVFY